MYRVESSFGRGTGTDSKFRTEKEAYREFERFIKEHPDGVCTISKGRNRNYELVVGFSEGKKVTFHKRG